MKLGETIKDVVQAGNAGKAGRIVDMLRFKHKLNYQETFEMFNRLTDISLPDFENLMYEADSC